MLKDVTIRATRRVANHDDSVAKRAEANHPNLTIVFTHILDLEADAVENFFSVLEVEPTGHQSDPALFGVKRN
jgi:hypothetical protein